MQCSVSLLTSTSKLKQSKKETKSTNNTVTATNITLVGGSETILSLSCVIRRIRQNLGVKLFQGHK